MVGDFMSAIAFEILFILSLILANGIFAMSEMALVSARKGSLQQRANAGDAKARVALELANTPNRFLSTVQIGITLIGILAGAFGGATLASELAARLRLIRWLAPYSEVVSLAIVVLSIAYLSLIIGELVPKRLALHNPEQIASVLAGPMRRLSVIASPAVRLLSLSTNMILRILGARQSTEAFVTEEEIKILLDQGTEAGTFEKAEREMIERVFQLGDRRAGALMTPRAEIVWLDPDEPLEEIRRKVTESVHSRFPVAQGSLDNVRGIIRSKDLLTGNLQGRPLELKAALWPPLFVLETTPALKILELFKQSGTHIALVVDEHGGIQGLVSLNDILEEIVGNISSVDQAAQPLAVRRDDGSWLLDGKLPIDEFKQLFRLATLPDETSGRYQTLAGFVMMCLGRIPSTADHFEWGGLRLEVVDMDGRRIDKVLVSPFTATPLEQAFPHVDLRINGSIGVGP